MADAKISQLTALTTAADDDLLAIVDTSATETKKIAKSDLVAGLQAELVSGTNIKTINSTSLLGSGDISISASPAGTAGQIQFSDGSAFAADSNLFWDDTNKRLGVGETTPTARVHITQPNTTTVAQVISVATASNISCEDFLQFKKSDGTTTGGVQYDNGAVFYTNRWMRFNAANSTTDKWHLGIYGNDLNFAETNVADGRLYLKIGGNVGIGTTSPTARLQVKGSGSTSATTSLLVQNSAGTDLLKVTDDGQFYISTNDSIIRGLRSINHTINSGSANYNSFVTWNNNNGTPSLRAFNDDGSSSIGIGTSIRESSAILFLQSTTKGFLPPRMTTTQKNAISTPAAGLQLYDSTTSRPCVYTTAWESLTSSDSASPTAVYKFWSGTAAQYAALTPDANTVYFVS